MKRIFLFLLGIVMMLGDAFAQIQYKEVSGIYAGGHIRRGRPGTITKLRNSGFTYLILFNVNVEADGTLTTDGETICKNGQYVFSETQPYYQEDVANLKAEHSSISRIEICIGGWGNGSYGNIRNLVNSKGTGRTSILYRNFKALKEAVPEIDAVNNDTEQDYDAESAAKFHIMMYDLGYKTTIAPYTYMSYWTQLVDKIRASRPQAVDRAMIQCYDGGAGNLNNVGSWNFTGVSERHPGLLDYSNDWSVERNLAQFQSWKDQGVATGGFVWLFNDGYDETWDMNGWASGLNRIFGAISVPEDQVVVKCYSEKNYGGYCVGLPPGTYHQGDLAVYGLKANDLSSIEILDNYYIVKLYTSPNCTGSRTTKRTSSKILTTALNDKICSIEIEPNPTGIEDISQFNEDEGETIYNLSGQKLSNRKLSNGQMQKGIYIVGGRKIIY